MPIQSQHICVKLCITFLLSTHAYAQEITSGHLIQIIDPIALENSSTFVVNQFFDEQSLVGRLRADLIEDSVLTAEQLASNTFTYALHGSDFTSGHPSRVPGINSFPSNFTFDPVDILQSATSGRIGLGGVMRFNLPPREDGTPRFFMLGDWTLEYDKGRTEGYNYTDNPNKPIRPTDYQVSGWFLRNHIDFPAIGFDVLQQTLITNSDSFYLSGELAWAPEIVEFFLPETELYRSVAHFVMCAQDDNALATHTAQQIPCVFPQITLNGQTGTVQLNPPEQINLALNLGIASTTQHPNADYFIAFIYQNELYWLNSNLEWTTTIAAVYQGALIDFREIALPSPTQIIGSQATGTSIPFYFAVDVTQNGVFDEPYRFANVTLQIN